jgi:hypothetical protein
MQAGRYLPEKKAENSNAPRNLQQRSTYQSVHRRRQFQVEGTGRNKHIDRRPTAHNVAGTPNNP